MDVREKLVELLWEYDQMRMMRMSIEECADRLIPKGLTVGKCENDTKCSDLAICLDENAKEKTERIVDLMTSFYGVDPGYYGVEAYPFASHLISHGVTVQDNTEISDEPFELLRKAPITVMTEEPTVEVVQEWISVDDRLPDDNDRVIAFRPNEPETSAYKYCVMWGWSLKASLKHRGITHWREMPQPPKGE